MNRPAKRGCRDSSGIVQVEPEAQNGNTIHGCKWNFTVLDDFSGIEAEGMGRLVG